MKQQIFQFPDFSAEMHMLTPTSDEKKITPHFMHKDQWRVIRTRHRPPYRFKVIDLSKPASEKYKNHFAGYYLDKKGHVDIKTHFIEQVIEVPHFAKEINKLNQNLDRDEVAKKVNDSSWHVVRTGKQPPYQYYAYYLDEPVGAGAYGKVYRAYRLDEKGNADLTDNLIVKIIDLPERKKKKELAKTINKIKVEANIYNCYYQVDGLQFIRNPHVNQSFDYIYLFAEYVPGNKFRKLDKNLTWQKRLDIACNIVWELNLLHHHTVATGKAIVHGDIKSDNLLFDAKNGDFHFIDFGNSLPLRDEDKIESSIIRGDRVTIPPEMLVKGLNKQYINLKELFNEKKCIGMIGVKSDIFKLAPIMMSVFGAINPYSKYDDILTNTNKHFDIQKYKNNVCLGFDNTGMFQSYNKSIPNKKLQQYLLDFIKRMGALHYSIRPSSDEVLRFFITLRNLSYLYENCENQKDLQQQINICEAKVALLSLGYWRKQIGSRAIECFSHLFWGRYEKKRVIKTFEHFDFEANYKFSKAIANLSKNNLLTPGFVNCLVKGDDLSAKLTNAINILGKYNMLCQENIGILAKGDQSATQVANIIIQLANKKSKLNNTFDNSNNNDNNIKPSLF